MGQQRNKIEKARRRSRYLKRRKIRGREKKAAPTHGSDKA